MDLLKQTDSPLFPDILWNQPVTKRNRGKLLIVGGHSQQFSLTQDTFAKALAAGAGEARVVLPQNIRKLIGAQPDCLFVAATPSGSIAREAQDEVLGFAGDSDAVLLPGELSFNNETTGLIETLLLDSSEPFVIGSEIVRMLLHAPEAISRAAAIVATPGDLSELAAKLHIPIYVKKSDLQKEQKLLRALQEKIDVPIVCYGQHVLVSHGVQLSLTPSKVTDIADLMAHVAVFYMQHPDKFQALTTAVYQATKDGDDPTKG